MRESTMVKQVFNVGETKGMRERERERERETEPVYDCVCALERHLV